MGTFSYWSNPYALWDEDAAATGTLAYTPKVLHGALNTTTPTHEAFIEETTNNLYRVTLSDGTVTLVDSTYDYLDMITGTSSGAYVLRSDGEVWLLGNSTFAVAFTGVTNPEKFAGYSHWVLDTSGYLWYDNSGMTQWAGHTWKQIGYANSWMYIGIGLDGKAYGFTDIPLYDPTVTQIGSDTDWVGVNWAGRAFNTSGEVYTDMDTTPSLLEGADPIERAATRGCGFDNGFFTTTGKMTSAYPVGNIGSWTNVVLAAYVSIG